MKYSPKALFCCLSKGALVVALGAGLLSGAIFGLIALDLRQARIDVIEKERCADLPVATSEQLQRYRDECVVEKFPEWVGSAVLLFFGGLVVLLVIWGVCDSVVDSCQLAVDLGRKPFYWLPYFGKRLPQKIHIEDCSHCYSQRLETEEEFRERLGI